MDADVQRRQSLIDNSLQVGLREAGQSGEVPVQKAEAVIVILQIQALSHPGWQLIDETERTVIVARSNSIEDGAGDLQSERFAFGFVDRYFSKEATSNDLNVDCGLVREKSPFDDVTR